MSAQIDLTPEVRAALDRYLAMTYGDLSDTDRMAEFLYNTGWRECLAAMVAFQDLPAQIRRIEARVHELGVVVSRHGGESVADEDERPSVYWSAEP